MKTQLRASAKIVMVNKLIRRQIVKMIKVEKTRYSTSLSAESLYVSLRSKNPTPEGRIIVRKKTDMLSKKSTISTEMNNPNWLKMR